MYQRTSKKNKKWMMLLLTVALLMPGHVVSAQEDLLENAQETEKESENTTSEILDMNMFPAEGLFVREEFSNGDNSYETCKAPAQIKKLDRYYFIVDTFHDQVIYSTNLYTPILDWKVLTRNVSGPHAIASDGKSYLVVDTENNRVQIFEWVNGGFQNTQRLSDIGQRPHYIEYDVETDTFWVWSSTTGEMYILQKEPISGKICIKEIRKIKELDGFYVRSFKIVGDKVLFPSGTNQYIICADKETLAVENRFAVAKEISGMAYITVIGDQYYMTVSCDDQGYQNAPTVLRTKDLNGIKNGDYEVIKGKFGGIGIPYYIDQFDGSFFMTNHGTRRNVIRFQVDAQSEIDAHAQSF